MNFNSETLIPNGNLSTMQNIFDSTANLDLQTSNELNQSRTTKQVLTFSETSEATWTRLKYFLATAPAEWPENQYVKNFYFPNEDKISCILWNSLYHITGTDIVKILAFRFEAFGRPVSNPRKFEEGIFSDLRSLKTGVDATLEDAKSDFLGFLYKNKNVRTQKRQKVFFWFSVNHDRLFMDALERDLKRESLGLPTTTFSSTKMDSQTAIELAKDQCKSLADFGIDDVNYPQTQSFQDFHPQDITQIPELIKLKNNFNVSVNPNDFSSDFSDFSTYDSSDSGKIYECDQLGCNRTFKRFQHLNRHKRSHTGEKPFACQYPNCGKSFSRCDNLTVHEKRHNLPYGAIGNEFKKASLPKFRKLAHLQQFPISSFTQPNYQNQRIQSRDNYFLNLVDSQFNQNNVITQDYDLLQNNINEQNYQTNFPNFDNYSTEHIDLGFAEQPANIKTESFIDNQNIQLNYGVSNSEYMYAFT